MLQLIFFLGIVTNETLLGLLACRMHATVKIEGFRTVHIDLLYEHYFQQTAGMKKAAAEIGVKDLPPPCLSTVAALPVSYSTCGGKN